MTLPPLPTGHTIGCGIFNGQKLFTAGQMRAYAEQAVAAERERWKVAATAATQELCQCAPWTAGGQAFASLRQLIDGPNVGIEPPRSGRLE